MKKAVRIGLILIIALLLFAGCKIETPEQAALNAQKISEEMAQAAASGISADESLSAEPLESAAEPEYIDSEYVNEHYSGNPAENYDKYEGKEVEKYDASAKDRYLTEPVPSGKPKPVEWQDVKVDKNTVLNCTLTISCKTILKNKEKLNADKEDALPSDGIILKKTKLNFYKGESVFDVLLRETKKNRIQMEYAMAPLYNSNYIEGIHNLYEFDCGELSGWMYSVNGWFPNYGCSRYQLGNGDDIKVVYTCDLGRDVGAGWLKGRFQ